MIQKNIFLLLLLGCLGRFSFQPVNAQSIDDAEFMGFIPGMLADSLPPIKAQGKYQKLDRAIPLVKDSLVCNGIPVKSMVLFFHRSRLHSIDIKISPENSDAMLTLLEALYGPAEKIDNLGVQRRWMGDKIGLFYDKNMITQESLYSFISFEVNERYKAWLDWLTAPK